jgi:putative transposase
MNPPTYQTVRSNPFIIMPYKQQCKAESVILVRIKIIRAVLSGIPQKEVCGLWHCSKNTIGAIMSAYRELSEKDRALLAERTSLTTEHISRFSALAYKSRAPHGNKRSLAPPDEKTILDIHQNMTMGPRRMHTHLSRRGENMQVYTLPKIRGCYKRNKLIAKKIRTANKERRPLYDYAKLAAFERLHMDTKHILDKHALPKELYEKFKNTPDLPIYQWTIQDAKTRMRFLAYSHDLSSFFGQRFLLFTIEWLRAHGIFIHINVLFDGGAEFCSASPKKLADWQTFFDPYGVTVSQTYGDKTRQNLIERSHLPDDQEFYCPRGEFMSTKTDFLLEAQRWNIYWNCERGHSGIGMHGLAPAEKLASLGYTNAEAIGRFPTFILEDIHRELYEMPTFMARQPKRTESQNVLTYYHIFALVH